MSPRTTDNQIQKARGRALLKFRSVSVSQALKKRERAADLRASPGPGNAMDKVAF
jgi:hypothetical protein